MGKKKLSVQKPTKVQRAVLSMGIYGTGSFEDLVVPNTGDALEDLPTPGEIQLNGGLYGNGSYEDLAAPKPYIALGKPSEFTEENLNVRKTGAMKNDIGKLRFCLLPVQPLRDITEVLMFGAKKYGDYNWQKGFNWTDIYDATQRHLTAWLDGENIDPESGLPHLAHAACNLFFLLVFRITHPELDNRFKK